MSEIQQQILEAERQIAESKVLIEIREAAIRLYDNPDFRKLIVKGYLLEDCARFVHQSGDPSLDLQGRADALAMAQACGHLKRYLSAQIQMGYVATNSIQDMENVLEELRAEEGAE